ncbi:sulfotransferase 1A1 isoform X2 [Rhipicephalus microplus]|uniref:sulfotransferase 1A1 isoform X2 n=1 Tax=Rhipicephalus microplus TaxID=6941 RepID=UPI003F6AB1D4
MCEKAATTRPKPYYQIIDGVPRCPFMTAESLRQGLGFVACKGDLLQVSYPRSGTHWVQYITQLILKEGEPVDTYEQFMEGAKFIEYFSGIDDCKPGTLVRTLCTHLPLRKEKLNPEAKYVYVARNPWDVCVSLYHHERNISAFRFEEGAFDDFLEVFLTGELGYGFYFDHVKAGPLQMCVHLGEEVSCVGHRIRPACRIFSSSLRLPLPRSDKTRRPYLRQGQGLFFGLLLRIRRRCQWIFSCATEYHRFQWL